MFVLKGTKNIAKVFADKIEDSAQEQILKFLDHPVFKGTKISIMPDTHAGTGAVIGFTCQCDGEYVISNVIGVDIGCGCLMYNLGKIDIDFERLDNYIRKNIPSGFHINADCYSTEINKAYWFNAEFMGFEDWTKSVYSICDKLKLDPQRVWKSLKSMGSGNHFCELNKDEEGNVWISVHSGSRNFGLQIANYHQNKAKELMKKFFIDEYKDLEFLPKDMGGSEYLEDMFIAQQYADVNRKMILIDIVENFFEQDCNFFNKEKTIHSVHNYMEDNHDGTYTIRKGAISAKFGERVVIPISMRDGVIIGKGKSNANWNYSAPHGAGRLMGRNEAKRTLSLEEYKETMKDVWSSCISEKTLDEAPMAYKSMDFILNQIKETVYVETIAKPIYNFKAQD